MRDRGAVSGARDLWKTAAGLPVLLTLACSGGEEPTGLPSPPAVEVAEVRVAPSDTILPVGARATLRATLLDAAGNALAGRTVAWSTSDAAVASVEADGSVLATAPGEARITASSEGTSGTATVTVESPPQPVDAVTVEPGELTLAVGASAQLTATVLDAEGNVLADRVVSWSSSSTAIARVDALGVVRADAPGEVMISATAEGKSGGATVSVVTPEIVGPKIAFNTDRDGNFEIYVMDPDGANPLNLTRHPADDIQPTWSPDGTRIAFASDRTGDFELYAMNADGTGLVRLTDHPAGSDLFPSWSGSRIAFERDVDWPFTLEIFVMNEDGSDPVNLTNNVDFAEAPSLSRDGTKIAFHSDRDFDIDFTEFEPEIFVMDADGGNPINVTNHDTAGDAWPEWSPDGSRIAFASNRSGNGDIFVMQSDGSNPVNLTQHPGGDFLPAWSPDGSRIVFTSLRDGNNEIYSVAVDGSDLQRLTENGAADAHPAWRP